MRNLSLVFLAACAACGSTAASSHLALQLSATGVFADGGAEATVQMRAGETTTVVLVAVGATEATLTFSAENLPSFASLSGPILTLAPQRPDAGDFAIRLRVADGHGNEATAPLHLSVLRFNTPPSWYTQITPMLGGFSDGPSGSRFRINCPSPTLCTADENPQFMVSGCDAEGDGIRVDIEVVQRGQTFSKRPTFSASAPAEYPPRPPRGNCVNLKVPMPGLVHDVSYDFAVRVSDDLGAISPQPGAPDGWVHDPLMSFDQGPCTTRQCACGITGYACLVDSDCCNGCNLRQPYGQCK